MSIIIGGSIKRKVKLKSELTSREKRQFNDLISSALENFISPVPNYKLIKKQLEIALRYKPLSKELIRLIQECDNKLRMQSTYTSKLKECMKNSKKSELTADAISCYIQSVKINPLHELAKQYDKLMIKNLEKIQLTQMYKDTEIRSNIKKALKYEKEKQFKLAYAVWYELFKKKKFFTFFKKMLSLLIIMDYPVKAGLLVIHVMENHIDSFKQLDIDKYKIEWIHKSVNRVLLNCKFIQSHINNQKYELNILINSKLNTAFFTEISKKKRQIKISTKKLDNILNSLINFLKIQFILDI